MDVKNITHFFQRRGVDTLSERNVFGLITAAHGALDEPELSAAIDQLYDSRATDEAGAEATANEEVDDEVFRRQYMPQTLDQVYDIERDAEKIQKGEGAELVYGDLLAETGPTSRPAAVDTSDAGEVGGSHSAGSGSDDEHDGRFDSKPPRGRRFEDKDVKKASSRHGAAARAWADVGQEHKKQVKDEKREARKTKMPKHVKKKLISASASRHK